MFSSVLLAGLSSYIMGYAFSKVADPVLDAAIAAFKGKSSVERAYERALKKWGKNNSVRNLYANNYLSSLYLLGQYLENGAIPVPELEELCRLYEEELKKDHDTFVYLNDLKTKYQEKLLADITHRLDSLEQPEITGNRAFSKVPRFIPRFCEPISDDSGMDRFLNPDKYRPVSLLDLVLKAFGDPGADNKFVLYGDAQSGKTTLVKQLGYELSQSGLISPVMYEVKEYKNLISLLPNFEKHQREYVLLIDALDERFKDEDRKSLFNELNGYARRYPDLIMILTCRSNFIEPAALSEFIPISLMDLGWADAKMVLQEHGIPNPESLLAQIEEKGLYEFARKPAELLAIAEIYLSKNRLPHNVGEIMEHLIHKQLSIERNKLIGEYDSPEESLEELEKVAVALQLMEQNYIKEADLHILLGKPKSYNLVQRSGLLVQSKNESGYGFVHNSFKEYLVVRYLLSIKDIAQLRSFCCYDGSARIKDTWNNVVLLLLSSVPAGDVLAGSIVNWLKDAENQKLLVHADPGVLPESRRADICIGMLEAYKELGLMLDGSWNSAFYSAFMRFGHSERLIRYIYDNLAASKEYTFHTINLLHCSRFVNWTLLIISNKSLANLLREGLFSVFLRLLNSVEDPYYIFVPFSNPFFYNLSSLKRLNDMMADVEAPKLIDEFIDIVVESGHADNFMDFVMKKGHLVKNYSENGVTHLLTRIHVYKAFESVSSSRGVRMAMIGMCYLDPDDVNFEGEEFSRVWKTLVEKAEDLSLSDAFMYRRFCQLTARSRFGERLFNDGCKVMADYFRKRGIDGQMFDRTVRTIFRRLESKSNYDSDYLYTRASYLIDEEKAERIANEYHSSEGYILLMRIGVNAEPEVYNLIDKIRKEKMPEFYILPKSPDYEEVARRDFEELLDYDAFRTKVLNVIDDIHPLTREDLRKRYRPALDDILESDRISRYISAYFYHFADESGNYNLEAARKMIEDRDFYDRFILSYDNSDKPRPQIFTDTAKRLVMKCVEGGAWPGYQAMKIMLTGGFEIDKKAALFYLSYSKYAIAYSDGHYHREKNVFDAVSSRDDVSPSEIMDIIGPKLDSPDFFDENGLLMASLCRYFVKNKLERYMDYCVKWVVESESINTAYRILEEALESETLQAAFSDPSVIELIPDDRKPLLLKKLYVDKLICEKEVMAYIEPRLDDMPEESMPDALRLLVGMGSIKALNLVNRQERWKNGDFRLYFKYSQPEVLPLLYDLLRHYYPQDIHYHESRSSVLESIGSIAISNEGLFLSVSEELRRIYDSDTVKYKYLMAYVESWQKNMLQSRTRHYSLTDVKELLTKYPKSTTS